MQISAIAIYPVKSLGAIALSSAEVGPRGMAGDRRWMIVDAGGRFVTRRECPALARIGIRPGDAGDFHLTGPEAGMAARLPFVPEGGLPGEVRVWRDIVPARLFDNDASRLISATAGRPLRLAYMPDDVRRPVDPRYGRNGDMVSFADGYPILLASGASLDALNAALEQPVPMDRFRPSLVVSGAGLEAWAETRWRRVRAGDVLLDLIKPCSRCIVITQDHRTGERPDGAAPLKALRALGRFDGSGVLFGENAIPRRTGRVAVGDRVGVEEEGQG